MRQQMVNEKHSKLLATDSQEKFPSMVFSHMQWPMSCKLTLWQMNGLDAQSVIPEPSTWPHWHWDNSFWSNYLVWVYLEESCEIQNGLECLTNFTGKRDCIACIVFLGKRWQNVSTAVHLIKSEDSILLQLLGLGNRFPSVPGTVHVLSLDCHSNSAIMFSAMS